MQRCWDVKNFRIASDGAWLPTAWLCSSGLSMGPCWILAGSFHGPVFGIEQIVYVLARLGAHGFDLRHMGIRNYIQEIGSQSLRSAVSVGS